MVVIALQGGAKGEVDLARVMQRRLTITGSGLRPRDVEFKRSIKKKLAQLVWPLLANGAIKPIIDKVFPMENAAGAHAYMEKGEHRGKIVLAVAEADGI